MARTTISLVRDLLRDGSLGGDYDDTNLPSLTVHIDTATTLVDWLAAQAVTESIIPAFTDGKLELIERWLAAHCYAQSDRIYTSKSTDGASGSFALQLGQGLKSTPYGQMAMKLDHSGLLQSIDTPETPVRRVAGISWLGKRKSEQTDYLDRD